MPACSAVPWPMSVMRRLDASARAWSPMPPSTICPARWSTRPWSVRVSAAGCSKISLSMKCSKPPSSISERSTSSARIVASISTSSTVLVRSESRVSLATV